MPRHDFGESGICFCGAQGLHKCEWNIKEFFYLHDNSGCKIIYYSCFYCEDTYDVITQHEFDNGVCTACGFVFASDPEVSESSADNGTSLESGSEETGSVFGDKTFSDLNFSPGIALFFLLNIIILGFLFFRWIFKKL